MNFIEIAHARQSCRSYDPCRVVEKEKLDAILAESVVIPQTKKAHPWIQEIDEPIESYDIVFGFGKTENARKLKTEFNIFISEIKQNGVYDENNSRNYILQLMDTTPTAANVLEYVEILKDKTLLRRVAEASGEVTALIQGGSGTGSEVLEAAEQKIYAIRKGEYVEGDEPSTPKTLSGIPDRPYCKGRAYDPNRYSVNNTEE